MRTASNAPFYRGNFFACERWCTADEEASVKRFRPKSLNENLVENFLTKNDLPALISSTKHSVITATIQSQPKFRYFWKAISRLCSTIVSKIDSIIANKSNISSLQVKSLVILLKQRPPHLLIQFHITRKGYGVGVGVSKRMATTTLKFFFYIQVSI